MQSIKRLNSYTGAYAINSVNASVKVFVGFPDAKINLSAGNYTLSIYKKSFILVLKIKGIDLLFVFCFDDFQL